MQREKEEEVKAVEETNKKKELEERARQEYDKVGAEGVGRGGGGGGEEYRKRGSGGGETCTYIYTYVRACFLGMVYCFYIIVVVMQWMEKKRKEQTQNKLANKVTQEKKVDKGELINTSDYWKRYLPVTPHVCPLVEWLVGLLGCLVG